jgi:hypothetical protein
MTMKHLALAVTVAALFTSISANAEIYQWKDENGKTVMSDKPPIGTTYSKRKNEAAVPAENTAPQKTTADRELDFRKRQQESREAADKSLKEQAATADKKENCANARRYLESLESGERIALRDDKGERYFMEDEQRKQEIAKARQNSQAACK